MLDILKAGAHRACTLHAKGRHRYPGGKGSNTVVIKDNAGDPAGPPEGNVDADCLAVKFKGRLNGISGGEIRPECG